MLMSESALRLLRDAREARKQGPEQIARRQRVRLAGLVAYARAHSPYYRELYQDLPEQADDPALLPVTSKKTLMAGFDDWVTDRAVTLERVRAFADNPELVGERFQGRYLVATTSGASGQRGLFVLDDRNLAVIAAFTRLVALAWLSGGEILRSSARGGRSALVIATGAHFMGFARATQLRKNSRWNRRATRIFSAHTPLPQLVAELNRFRPAVVLSYASTLTLLAGEQEAGRLRINPVLMHPAGETLQASEAERIATVFHTKVRTGYSATECPFLGYSCEHGWLHVNSDWVVLEPVGPDYRPTPPGEPSHTVLISNLANRVQPILRYDLGDTVLARPDPCPCGNPLAAIRVHGRAADVLTFPTDRGEQVSIAALALNAPFDRIPGVELFQIVQTTPASLRVHLRAAAGADPDRVWQAVHADITQFLTEHKAGHVTVERAKEPPQQLPGGKYRPIIPLGDGAAG
jgi:phenylacetate-CoA ligase